MTTTLLVVRFIVAALLLFIAFQNVGDAALKPPGVARWAQYASAVFAALAAWLVILPSLEL